MFIFIKGEQYFCFLCCTPDITSIDQNQRHLFWLTRYFGKTFLGTWLFEEKGQIMWKKRYEFKHSGINYQMLHSGQIQIDTFNEPCKIIIKVGTFLKVFFLCIRWLLTWMTRCFSSLIHRILKIWNYLKYSSFFCYTPDMSEHLILLRLWPSFILSQWKQIQFLA